MTAVITANAGKITECGASNKCPLRAGWAVAFRCK
jgi:hypothetical protein